jgi:type VI secretion system secreted protein Hcp
MALMAYLKLKAETQGEIKGSITQKGREDSIGVIAITHEVISPRDAASGLPTGKRQHKPFTITKELDKATPLLYKVLCHNENIKEWTLQFWQPGATGKEIQHYTVKLTNANIAGITFKMANTRNPELTKYNEFEEVSFTYEKIEWTWTNGGITADDDWSAPNA